ncbi:MAG: hypothetical protein ACOVO3_08480 [Fluviicola sp.]|jgi:hypothetical protein
MKYFFILFLLVSSSVFGQSIERQLYTRYFKALFPYEPAMVREQKLEEITEWRTDQWQHVTLTKRTKLALFRADGRPTFYAERQPFGGDSLISTYSYDSLNNLVEYKSWSSHNVSQQGTKYNTHYVFTYSGNRLQKVLLYAYDESWSSKRLVYAHTLTYSPDLKHVTINNGKTVTTLQEIGDWSKKVQAVDKEELWKTNCQYADTSLRVLQRFYQIACLDEVLKAGLNQQHILYQFNVQNSGKLVYNEADFSKQTVGFYLDTVKKELFSKSVTSMSEPTSLADRFTHTATLSHFSPSLQLDYTITTREVSRGNYEYNGYNEYSIDSIQSFYTYTPFGWQQQRIEYHYPTHQMQLQTNGTESEKSSYMPNYVLKEWMEWKRRE